MHVWKPTLFNIAIYIRAKLNVNSLSRIIEWLHLCYIIIYLTVFIILHGVNNLNFSSSHSSTATSDFVWGRRRVRCMVSLIRTFRSVIRRFRHRTLSGIVGEFVAGVAFQNCLRSQVLSTSTLDFVWSRRRVRRWYRFWELFAQSVIVNVDIGLCLESSACSSLVLLFWIFRLIIVIVIIDVELFLMSSSCSSTASSFWSFCLYSYCQYINIYRELYLKSSTRSSVLW